MKRFAHVMFLAIFVSCGLWMSVLAESDGSEENMNKYVIETLMDYPTDGTHKYWWGGGYDGATTDVYYMDTKVMRGEPEKRTYCCGLTLEVFWHAMEQYNKNHGIKEIKNLPVDKAKNFQHHWFCPAAKSWGPGEALTKYGMGKMIKNFDEARFGDFVQFWRHSGSGHSVIFVNWIRDWNDEIIGFNYWSAQKGTNGIGYNVEFFGDKRGVDKELFFICRLTDPKTWKPLEL